MTSNPKISILMPVFNEEKYISDAIESVISQTYSNFELIIIDDGSTDKTAEIVNKYSDRRIQFYQLGKIGKVAAFNAAYSKSIGEFICFFAGDDILVNDSISNRLKPIKKIVDYPVISFCKVKTFSKIKKFDGVVTPRDSNKGTNCGGAMMFNKKLAEIAFPIPDNIANEDLWINQHVSFNDEILIKHVPIIGINYRIHEQNSSSRTDSFINKTKSFHRRYIVYSIFLNKYRHILSSYKINRLISLAKAEDLRYKRRWFSILFIKNITINEKLRFIMHSNSFFYWLRIKLFSLFSGWG